MTQEKEQLLLIDLASRIPYKVIGQVTFNRSPKQPCKKVIDGNLYDRFARAQDNWYDNVQIIPYLRPLSTMTDAEREYVYELSQFKCTPDKATQKIDFYNSHFLDYRGLIKKGLAIEAPKGMYDKTRNKNE